MNALSEFQKQDGERNNKGDPHSDNDSSLQRNDSEKVGFHLNMGLINNFRLIWYVSRLWDMVCN